MNDETRPENLDAPAGPRTPVSVYLAALRPMQWTKNALMLVPLLAGHAIAEPRRWGALAPAIAAMCLAASATYLLNDVIDRPHDQTHPSKQHRPITAGRVAAPTALVMSIALAMIALLIAALVDARLGLAVAIYMALSGAYCTHLKRLPIIDVLVLASLFTLRVIAGGIAVDLFPSPWLLTFSMFLFLSLAFVKRYSEMRRVEAESQFYAAGRGYHIGDLPLLSMVGLISGYLSVLVLTLYINSTAVRDLYTHPRRLFLVCPVLLYWITRLWLLAHRGEVDDDPLLFALSDPVSWVCGGLALLVAAGATLI